MLAKVKIAENDVEECEYTFEVYALRGDLKCDFVDMQHFTEKGTTNVPVKLAKKFSSYAAAVDLARDQYNRFEDENEAIEEEADQSRE